jgi:predicted RNA methylase
MREGELETALGLEIERVEAGLSLTTLAKAHPNELFEYDGTSVDAARAVLQAFCLAPGDVVFDLGSGYGTLCLVGAMMSPARFVGVELVRERHLAAERIRRRFDLENVSLINANAVDVDLSHGNKFYMFSPFFGPALARVGEKLRQAAQDHPITVGTLLTAATHLSRLDRFVEVKPDRGGAPLVHGIPLRLFRSV